MRIAASCLFVALVSSTAVAQQTTTPFRDEIEVRVIDIDVAVTDRQGNPITGLKREDFELYENGRRVEIAYFSRIADGRIAELPAPAPHDGEAAPELTPTPRTPRTPLTWLVYIDQTNLAPQRRNQAMRQLQAFLPKAVTAGDRGAIAVNDGRSFKLRQGLTDDTALLNATLAKIERERVMFGPAMTQAYEIRNEISNAKPDPRPECWYMPQSIANTINAVIDEEAGRTRNAIVGMHALLDAVARLEGRVALVYVGAGFSTLPALPLVDGWNTKFHWLTHESYAPDAERHKVALEQELARLHANFSAMRVTVYTIDGGAGGGAPSAADPGEPELTAQTSGDRASLTEAGLARAMAERTGGLYFKVSQALSTQLDAVRRDLSNYYSLGYKPSGKASKERQVKVKVNAPGARVRHRGSVRERTRHEEAAGALVAALVQPQPRRTDRIERVALAPAPPPADVTAANPFGVSVQTQRPRPENWGRAHVLPFDFSMNLQALSFLARGNAHRADFAMHFALVGRDGSVYPLETREQSLAIPAAELTAAGAGPLNYSWHVDLAPLRIHPDIPVNQDGMRLTVTVEDRASGARSIVTVPVGKGKKQ